MNVIRYVSYSLILSFISCFLLTLVFSSVTTWSAICMKDNEAIFPQITKNVPHHAMNWNNGFTYRMSKQIYRKCICKVRKMKLELMLKIQSKPN